MPLHTIQIKDKKNFQIAKQSYKVNSYEINRIFLFIYLLEESNILFDTSNSTPIFILTLLCNKSLF